jgi:DNA-binding transcriptional ArsR family regulator
MVKHENKKSMTEAHITEAARLFSILSDPSRLKILSSLMRSPACVTEIVARTGLRQGNCSKHLATLLDAGFVQRERSGNFAIYKISDPRLHELCSLMCARIEESARARLAALTR